MATLSLGAASAFGAGRDLGLWPGLLLVLSLCAWAGVAGALPGEDPVGEIRMWLVFGSWSVNS